MPMDATLDGLLARAEAWLADDPEPATRDELRIAIEAARGGDVAAVDDLADRFAGMLQFGTAGLRGILGAGSNRMNRAVVIRAAAGLTAYLRGDSSSGPPASAPAPTVVVGFDARHSSDVFARDTAAVVTAAGGRALLLPRPLPTPVLAFAIRHLGADAGVMVTASHNPPRDNGYKVYLGDGSQIVPPADVEIAARIDAVESVASVARADGGWTTLGEEVVDAYLDAVTSVVDPATPRELTVVHTAMHGVGGDIVVRAFERAGFPRPIVVEEQAEPDPDFPTVPFPNPEEPGAMDLALAVARRVHPDVVIASDPDADRCAVAVRDPSAASPADPEGWRMLRGDEVGVLLGAHVIERGVDPQGAHAVLARSIVSSRLLGAMADAAGLPGVETLTGFKWIGRVPRLRYGYEEAIGYCVDPAHVADKDGISAALLMADMVAGLRARGPHAARRPRRPRPGPRRPRHRRVLGAGHRPGLDRRRDGPAAGGAGGRDRRGRGRPDRRPGRGRRPRPSPDRGPPLSPGRRHAGDRAPLRHGAEAEDLPGGDRPVARGPARRGGGTKAGTDRLARPSGRSEARPDARRWPPDADEGGDGRRSADLRRAARVAGSAAKACVELVRGARPADCDPARTGIRRATSRTAGEAGPIADRLSSSPTLGAAVGREHRGHVLRAAAGPRGASSLSEAAVPSTRRTRSATRSDEASPRQRPDGQKPDARGIAGPGLAVPRHVRLLRRRRGFPHGDRPGWLAGTARRVRHPGLR